MAFTYFFRDMQTLEMMCDCVLPEIMKHKYIHVWDAGCAMGPEPYSIAIILRERMETVTFKNLRIHATDIDESGSFGEIIKEGIYPEERLKRIPKKLFNKYFQSSNKTGYCKIIDEVKNTVFYQEHDLLTLNPIRDDISLVICKNVLLHFNKQQRISVIKMFHKAILEGGFLITEQTQKLPIEVESMFKPIVSNSKIFRKINGDILN